MSVSRGPSAPASSTSEPGASFLAVDLDDRIVLLEVGRGALHLLNSWTAQVWAASTGRSFEELLAAAPGVERRLRQALRELEAAGLVKRDGETWVAGAARRV